MGSLFFYIAKIRLYEFNSLVEYTPLSLLHKFAIPILSTIMMALTILGLSIYNLSYRTTMEMQARLLESGAKRTALHIDSFMERVLIVLNAHARSGAVRGMNPAVIQGYLNEEHRNKDEDIEFLFAANAAGNAPTSIGMTRNIADREYFKYVVKKGTHTFSEPVINKATGKEIMVGAVPVKQGNRVIGVMGATILMKTINEYLMRDQDENNVEPYDPVTRRKNSLSSEQRTDRKNSRFRRSDR